MMFFEKTFVEKLDLRREPRGNRRRSLFTLLLSLALVSSAWLIGPPRRVAAFNANPQARKEAAGATSGSNTNSPRRLRINGRGALPRKEQAETPRRLRINGRATPSPEAAAADRSRKGQAETPRRLRINGRAASSPEADAADRARKGQAETPRRLRINGRAASSPEADAADRARKEQAETPRRLRINGRAASSPEADAADRERKEQAETPRRLRINERATPSPDAAVADRGENDEAVIADATGAANSPEARTSFMDPSASLGFKGNIHIGERVYIGPFATLRAGYIGSNRYIDIGAESNLQDNATLDAEVATVSLGEQAIVAHGATVRGAYKIVGFRRLRIPARVGVGGKCQKDEARCPSFVGFNALVEGATIEKDAMVGILARVGPDVTIPSGYKVLPGRNITSNAQVTLESGNVAPVTEADREFMRGVVEVNCSFAEQYAALAAEDPSFVRGVNYDPGRSPGFNPVRDLPSHHGATMQDPTFRNRIIGDIRLEDDLQGIDRAMGARISLRADQGDPFEIGTIVSMGDSVTFHALEHTHLFLGDGGRYGRRSIVHGGPTDFPGLKNNTIAGNDFTLGDGSVFFRSRVGRNARIGARSLVQQSDLPDDTVIPDRRIIIGNTEFGVVEW